MNHYCSHNEFELITPGMSLSLSHQDNMNHYCSHDEFELITSGEHEILLFT